MDCNMVGPSKAELRESWHFSSSTYSSPNQSKWTGSCSNQILKSIHKRSLFRLDAKLMMTVWLCPIFNTKDYVGHGNESCVKSEPNTPPQLQSFHRVEIESAIANSPQPLLVIIPFYHEYPSSLSNKPARPITKPLLPHTLSHKSSRWIDDQFFLFG